MVVVFVHGIFSSCTVFEPLKEAIEQQCPHVSRTIDFSYAFLDSLRANAERLNSFLSARIADGEQVSIVAHSMGGLVSRMALLLGPADRPYIVRYLVMLATPNHGAIKMNQLNALADLIRRSIGKIPPIDHRSVGLDDLTRVDSILNDLLAADKGSVGRTKSVDYVTMPGLLYNDDHPYDERRPKKLTEKALSILASISARKGPVQLGLPHDGIVEELSVRMVTGAALKHNERTYYSTPDGKKSLTRNANLHIIHPDFRTANHVEIHSIARVCSLVPWILNSGGIDAWIGTLDEDERSVLNLSNGHLI